MTNITWIDEDGSEKEKERKYEQDGKTLIVYPTNPHGFWKIRFEKKTKDGLPRVLDGAFTGVTEAEKAIHSYFRQLKAEPKKVDLIGA
jgi:hypothetical protein